MVIDYYEGLAILQNDEGDLFYLECEEEHAPVGTVLENIGETIETLSGELQEEIRMRYGRE